MWKFGSLLKCPVCKIMYLGVREDAQPEGGGDGGQDGPVAGGVLDGDQGHAAHPRRLLRRRRRHALVLGQFAGGGGPGLVPVLGTFECGLGAPMKVCCKCLGTLF